MKKLIVLIMLLFIVSAIQAKNTRKVDREFKKRNAICLAEQARQQHQGIKHYHKSNRRK